MISHKSLTIVRVRLPAVLFQTIIPTTHNVVRKMSSDTQFVSIKSSLRSIFHHGVLAVQPKQLFASETKCFAFNSDDISDVLIVGTGDKKQTIDMAGKHCHLVGFGKAVLGMAVQIEQQLGDRLVSGVLSVPVGTLAKFAGDSNMKLRCGSCVEVYEGAADNLPDEAAADSSKLILRKCQQMGNEDVLIVLISGGGSALIPLPIEPVTVGEKRDLVRSLAGRQATINEINTVREAISKTKGGKLAEAAKDAHRCVSLVISDVCGDPLDIIASGPTYKTVTNTDGSAVDIIKKYRLFDQLPESIRTVLMSGKKSSTPLTDNSSIFVIGNNQLACESALAQAELLGFCSVIISTEVTGNVQELSQIYVRLIKAVYMFRNEEIVWSEWTHILSELSDKLQIKRKAIEMLSAIIKDRTKCATLCLIAGGEPTVEIKGSGVGGRNQELSLRLSVLLKEDRRMRNVMFLSAGTDGIDGPTPAAGAIACSRVYEDARQIELDVSCFLDNNDSFNFYRQLNGGEYHIMTGHTGTNVMDLHICVIPF